jgi:hypothetical protein
VLAAYLGGLQRLVMHGKAAKDGECKVKPANTSCPGRDHESGLCNYVDSSSE